MNLIVGLGNPGQRYRHTRHNVGFQVVDLWSRKLGTRLSSTRFHSRNARAVFDNKGILLLCPATFMNRSGQAVRECVDYYKLETGRMLIIHDDLDLPLGRIKVVVNGGAGGHKGVSSIVQHLGSSEFNRVKIGIGRPRYGETVEDYVLMPFYSDQDGVVKEVVEMAVHACELFVSEGIESAMNHINCQNLGNKEERS